MNAEKGIATRGDPLHALAAAAESRHAGDLQPHDVQDAVSPLALEPIVSELSVRDRSKVWRVLESVEDPEIPGISIVDLGIVRSVREEGSRLVVGLSPTYSGCPATDVITGNVRNALNAAGFTGARIDTVLSPPWSSDDLSERGKARLLEYGIAPPQYSTSHRLARLGPRDGVPCPRCCATRTRLTSEFGSTPCKALYKCDECLEPFEYFKCF